MTASVVTTARRPHPGRAALRTIVLDIGGPVGLFYVLHGCGVDDVLALIAGAVPPALSTTWTAVRDRRIDAIAVAVLLSMALSIVAALLGGGPRELLARGAWLSAPAGVWTLVSLLLARPLTYETTRTVLPKRAAVMEALWATEPRFRSAWRQITVVWGLVMLLDAGVRVVMAYTLPVAAVPALDTALTIGSMLILQVPTHLLMRRAGFWNEMFRPDGARRGPRPVELRTR
ncbi:VC0807 family protein [Pseudonocardia sp. GCM10023141]|uniref:VC0807 family protein n=1 Tax=Pseudonocardia sp. GCM10023141 TaxID=3252653 RepID=UPI0036238B26